MPPAAVIDTGIGDANLAYVLLQHCPLPVKKVRPSLTLGRRYALPAGYIGR